MKKSVCLIILIVFLMIISIFTIYTLTHKELRYKVEEEITDKIENITSNLSGNNLSEIYNVYLNEEKHKLKLTYYVTLNEENMATVKLDIFLDGVSIFSQTIANSIQAEDVKAVFENENIIAYVKLDMNNIVILSDEDQEYLLIDVGYFLPEIQEKYYLFNSEGESLVEEGILVKDSSIYYVSEDESTLNIFYTKDEIQTLAKIENNAIYALEAKEKDELQLIEYKYTIKDQELEKEKLNTYEGIKIKENVDNKENTDTQSKEE